MDNSAALRNGTAKAKKLIKENIMLRLDNLLYDVVDDMHNRMKSVPGMTGNTRTSPAGATYADGAIHDILIVGGNDSVTPPLQGKLVKGSKFSAGRIRYDGDVQQRTFSAGTDTTGRTSQEDHYEFLESRQAGKEMKMTVIGATEYLGHEQVEDNYVYCQDAAQRVFKA